MRMSVPPDELALGGDGAAVRDARLPRQRQADAAAARLGGEVGHEQVAPRLGADAGSVVGDADLEAAP